MIDVDDLRAKALAATPGPWELWTGCSWRRYGSTATGSTIMEPIKQRDGTADLWFRNGGSEGPDARYIAAASPDALLALLDALDKAERERDQLDAALRASCIDAREELREIGGGCSRAVAAEAERDALAALLRETREYVVGCTYDKTLLARIDAALAAREG